MPPTTDPCSRTPDKKTRLPGGISLHTYLNVPDADVVPLIRCRREDDDYWDDDFSATGSRSGTCTVLIYYKRT